METLTTFFFIIVACLLGYVVGVSGFLIVILFGIIYQIKESAKKEARRQFIEELAFQKAIREEIK
jgi:hypothetical protein